MPDRTCSMDGCDAERVARGWCVKHYHRWLRHGDPTIVLQPRRRDSVHPLTRFMRKVEPQPNGCWLWTGYVGENGRARVTVDKRLHYAYRWLYEHVNGPVPAGLVLDHFACDDGRCVNPWHVRPVSIRENTLRSSSVGSLNRTKTHCKWGHEFTDENTYVTPAGQRVCRTCRRRRIAEHNARQADAA